jgi:WD40 repeat protein
VSLAALPGAEEGKELALEPRARVLPNHEGFVYALAGSGDGARLFSGGGDGLVMVWDVDTLRQLQVLEGHRDRVTALATSGKQFLFSGSRDGTIRVWVSGVAS